MAIDVTRLSKERLISLLDETDDEALMDEIYDELERRERDLELRDWTEDDYWAAKSDLYEMWRREY